MDNLENDVFTWSNPLQDKENIELHDYFEVYKNRILQDSERLFITDFIYPLLGTENLKYLIPQYPFIDSEGKRRQIDFVLIKDNKRIALEIDGESYHAERAITSEQFDDSLFRQNEILNAGFKLLRFSYTQLQDSEKRKYVSNSVNRLVLKTYPEFYPENLINPTPLQTNALEQLELRREMGWKKGVAVLPTGTGKTFLAAFDSRNTAGKILFIVHRLDILSQAKDAFEKIYPSESVGLLTGEQQINHKEARILFASKDSLRNPNVLSEYQPNEFDYIIVDEVHHGQADSYKILFNYFEANFFMLGLTATPDRMDRKDIFELFDYQKVFEYTLNEAIENGFLVPYKYYGLKDNIDYSNIKYNNNRYSEKDLNNLLIIPKRNEQIFQEYLEKGEGNKAIGFCCSIKHANSMAEFFNEKGIPAISITSEQRNKDELIQDFRDNKYTIAFTADLFNEGIDFPDLRVLLFLRPTESKTVFLQQLGRGLRLCGGKSDVIILDFISNYKKANKIREYLSKSKGEHKNLQNGKFDKFIYEYSPKCEVHFDAEVEQILDEQDNQNREVTKEDLIAAYYELAEKLERKPSQSEINEEGQYKKAEYIRVFRTWVNFLREIGELTEASYHFPQGVHLGHILYMLKVIKDGKYKDTYLDDKYIKMRGGLDEGKLGIFQRQTKYKLQSLMELGLIADDRKLGSDIEYNLAVTENGKLFINAISPLLNTISLDFKDKGEDVPSWEMTEQPSYFNDKVRNYIQNHPYETKIIVHTFLSMPAVSLMINYLYRVERKRTISKNSIYQNFFKWDWVASYCDIQGIEEATEEASKRRCPFLLNMLESLGIIQQSRSDIEVLAFTIYSETMKLQSRESNEVIQTRLTNFVQNKERLSEEDISLFKETYGRTFLTTEYYLDRIIVII